MELYCTPKVNTLQLNTVKNSSNTRTRPIRTLLDDNESKAVQHCCVTKETHNVVLVHCCNSANVAEPREPHTCNNILVRAWFK
jgi:hypothetical protein